MSIQMLKFPKSCCCYFDITFFFASPFPVYKRREPKKIYIYFIPLASIQMDLQLVDSRNWFHVAQLISCSVWLLESRDVWGAGTQRCLEGITFEVLEMLSDNTPVHLNLPTLGKRASPLSVPLKSKQNFAKGTGCLLALALFPQARPTFLLAVIYTFCGRGNIPLLIASLSCPFSF